MATGGAGAGEVSLWDLNNPLAGPVDWSAGKWAINGLDFSKNGMWLASGNQDGSVFLYNLLDNTPTKLGEIGTVYDLSFSPSGKWLIAGLYTGEITLWQMPDSGQPPKEETKTLSTNSTGGVQSIVASPDDAWLAEVTYGGNLLLWDMTNLDAAPRIIQNDVSALDFSDDNQWLITGSNNGTVRIWRLNFDSLIPLACELAGRNLTQNEWKQYFPNDTYRRTCPQWPDGS